MSPDFSRSNDGWPPIDLRACSLFFFQPQPISLLPATQVPGCQKLHGQQGPGCRNGAGSTAEFQGQRMRHYRGRQVAPRHI